MAGRMPKKPSPHKNLTLLADAIIQEISRSPANSADLGRDPGLRTDAGGHEVNVAAKSANTAASQMYFMSE